MFQDNPLKLLYQHFVSAVNFCLFIIVDCKFSRLLFHVTRTPPWLFRPVNSELGSELYPNYFLSFVFGVVAAVPQVLRIWEGTLYPQALSTLHSFHTFSTCTTSTCFYQGFPRNQQFSLKDYRAYHCGLKYRPNPVKQSMKSFI